MVSRSAHTFVAGTRTPLQAASAFLGLVRDVGGVHPGQVVLVEGGAGSVGSAVVQLAAVTLRMRIARMPPLTEDPAAHHLVDGSAPGGQAGEKAKGRVIVVMRSTANDI